MDSDSLRDAAFKLQDINERMFWKTTPERMALVKHCHDLADLLLETWRYEDNCAEPAEEEAAAITKIIGMNKVLDCTLTDAYEAAEELQRVLELANVGTKKSGIR